MKSKRCRQNKDFNKNLLIVFQPFTEIQRENQRNQWQDSQQYKQ